MIGFLAVDSNRTDLDALKEFDVNEKFHLTSGTANASNIYSCNPRDYEWIPSDNVQYLSCIDHYGANQIRSNGRFLFDTSEVSAANPGAFSSILRSIRQRITSAHDNDGIYVDAQNADIDVYLIFSICGGTGSGAFLPLAYRIKSTLGSCNLIGYGFSHSFFDSVGVRENIKPNAYAALLELDFCMQAERQEYQIINFPGSDRLRVSPFDSFMYIDTNTYTKNNGVHSLTRKFQEVKDTVVNALLLSAGTVGAENRSILSNLNAVMKSPAGNIKCSKGGVKKAWVSSIGTSELICQSNADQLRFANEIAASQLDVLKKGPSAFDYTKWAKTLYNDILHINEGGVREEGDNDELINSILKPEDWLNLNPAAISVLDNGDYDTTQLNDIKLTHMRNMDVNTAQRKETCINNLRQYIIESLFPRTNVSHVSYGVDNIRTALSTFVNKVISFRAQMATEIEGFRGVIRDCEQAIAQSKKELEKIGQYTINGAAKRAQKQDEIALKAKEIIESELQIGRREKACEVYAEILAISDRYAKSLATLSEKINTSLSELSAKNADNDKAIKGDQTDSILIDLTPYAKSLASEYRQEEYKIKDWNAFYGKVLHHKSLEELSEVTSWSNYFVSYIEQQFPQATSPIILRALDKRLKEETALKEKGEYDEARSYINRVVDMARPLIDIDNYGHLRAVRVNLIRFVSLPVTTDTGLLERIQNAFRTSLGDEVEFISHANENRIIVFQQIGVFSPYFIKGIAEEGTQTESCEYKFKEVLSSGYSPFIDKEFIRVIKKNGHSLDQQIGCDSDENMRRWVKAIILGIVERGGINNDYRVESADGEFDLNDDRCWKSLGASRTAAYSAFSSSSSDFKKEIDTEISKRLKDPVYIALVDKIKNAGKDLSREYSSVRLIDKESEEFGLQENQHLLLEEIKCIKTM